MPMNAYIKLNAWGVTKFVIRIYPAFNEVEVYSLHVRATSGSFKMNLYDAKTLSLLRKSLCCF